MAAKPERSAGDDDLPHELWREILNRLSVKSILQCRSVCKSWYSLVSSPDFISEYSTKNLNKNDNRVLLRICNNRTRVWSYRSHDESLMESCEHDDDFPEPFRGKPLQMVGSCNGLICLSKYKRDATNFVTTITFLIWNPTLRKVVEVPSPTFCSRTELFLHSGFGFDSKTSDYKVLCVSEDDNASMYEIFDLRKGVWRAISPQISSCDIDIDIDLACYPECYLDGVVHWAGYKDRDDESSDRILLSFDMRDELFGEIRLPDCIGFIHVDDEEAYRTWAKSVTFGGLIHLITWKTDERLNVDMTRECSVWAMKEYGVTESWTKLFNIDQQSARLGPLDPFCLWKKGEILMVRRRHTSCFGWHRELLSYSPESGKCQSAFLITEESVYGVILLEESLVLM